MKAPGWEPGVEMGDHTAASAASTPSPRSQIELRPYQLDAVNRLREAIRRHRRVCFQLPTGAGKTSVFGYIARGITLWGRRALILVHRRELIRQTVEKLAFFSVEAGVIAAGWPADPTRLIQVASVQTLARRLDQAPEADLVVWTSATTPWPASGPRFSIATPISVGSA